MLFIVNLLRLTGDLCQIISIALFVHVVCGKKNASCTSHCAVMPVTKQVSYVSWCFCFPKTIGVSLKSQILYLFTFVTRYLNLFTSFYSWYNTFLKISFITSIVVIIYTIKCIEPTKSTYSSTQDEFNIMKNSIGPSVLLTVIFAYNPNYFDGIGLLWTYSIIQEVTAMVPQLLIAHYNRHIQSEIKLAIFCMGLHRFFYIVNWTYQAHTEQNYNYHWLVYICSILQVAIYSDFFYYTGTYVLFILKNELCNKYFTNQLFPLCSGLSTIIVNCRASGDDSKHIVSDENELSIPLLTRRDSQFDDVPTISEDHCKADSDLKGEANLDDIPSVQIKYNIG
jgi:ER lumen protein retaining receptor